MLHSVLLLNQREIFWALILAKKWVVGPRPPFLRLSKTEIPYRARRVFLRDINERKILQSAFLPYKSRKIKMGTNKYSKRKPVTIFGLPPARIAQAGLKL